VDIPVSNNDNVFVVRVVHTCVFVTQYTTLLLLGYVLCYVTCLYIKDDGERCQRDAEPFCHQHSDSRMALLYHTFKDDNDDTLDSGYQCEACDSPVQPVVTKVAQSNVRFTMYEAWYGLACECTTYENDDGTLPRRIENSEMPAEWE